MTADCISIPMWIAGIISLIICIVSWYGTYKNLPFNGRPEVFTICLMVAMITVFTTCWWLAPYAPCILFVK